MNQNPIIHKFPNGYGASIIRGNKAHFELAVLKGSTICYDTPLTDNVLVGLTSQEILDTLDLIKQLPPCTKN
jgi:hypothetical protein